MPATPKDIVTKSLFDEFTSEEELAGAAPAAQSDAAREAAEHQIRERQKTVDYNMKDYPVEVLVSKYRDGLEHEENEFFIPYYQREFVWNVKRQSRFIESILLGLPIPPLFLAGIEKEIKEDEGRLEIVDGSQRIRTLERYLSGALRLSHLDKLPLLTGTCFDELELSRQRKFKRHLIRVIELSERADEEVRLDLFERINTGSEELEPIEVRRGAQAGPFFNFLDELADDADFKVMVPIGERKGRRKEGQELLLRFFAYSDDYLNFKKRVDEFLTDFIKARKDHFDEAGYRALLSSVLSFAKDNFPYGFRKGKRFATVPRVRFEALAVGTALAMKEKPNLQAVDVQTWIESDEFLGLTTSDGSNSAPRLRSRIEYVRDRLLEAQP